MFVCLNKVMLQATCVYLFVSSGESSISMFERLQVDLLCSSARAL